MSERFALLIALLAVTLAAARPVPAHAYSGVADVTLSWGVGGSARSWSSSKPNLLAVVDNLTHFSSAAGSNGTLYFNADFAFPSNYAPGTADDCLTPLPGYDTIEIRRYGCRHSSTANGQLFVPSPPLDAGPAAAAVGTLNFTDTTLTGTLNLVATTDETGGASGFNLRVLDGFTYGNAWYGVSSSATLTVDLTGDFSAAGWEITGGTVYLGDPAFQCSQGGIGGGDGILCGVSGVPGGYSANGSHLSFGVDANGGLPGATMIQISVRDSAGTGVLATLGGVLASLNVGAGGSLSTAFGEYRSATGTNADGCQGQIRWDGSRISCGTLTAGALQITGTATPVDTEPDPYGFASVSGVALGTSVTSNAVTISGIAAPARITVAGGTYSIGCTATFTSAASNIADGATVCVRHTSAGTPATNTVTTLNIGNILGTYTSTTLPADTTPDAFAFVDQADVPASTSVVSAPVVIAGVNTATPVSVAGGEYSIGCTTSFTAVPGNVAAGQSVCVQHQSAAQPLTAVDTTLTVGGVSATFTSTTAAAPPDTTPDAFAFVDQANVPRATLLSSQPVVITGLTAAAVISVTGGEYSVGCGGSYTAEPGSIDNLASVCVRHTSAAGYSTVISTTLTIGGVADAFSSTTEAVPPPPDTTPDVFSFIDQAGVSLSATITSAPVIISGITAPAAVSITGGTYSVGCSASYTGTAGSIANGQTVCVRHTSSAANSVVTSTVLTIGGVTDTFSSTTVPAVPPPDTTPDAFAFVDRVDVALSAQVISAPVTIAGIDAPTAVSVAGGEYSVGCIGMYTAAAGSVSNGQQVCVRHTSAATNSTLTTTTLTVGPGGPGLSRADDFRSTTVAASPPPAAGGGGGGGAVDQLMVALLSLLLLHRRHNSRRRRQCLSTP